jgi:hypothetical protein
MAQPKLTLTDIQEALKNVKFMDREFHAMTKDDGFLIQMSYMEPDVEKPGSEPMLQKTRKWYVSAYMTESEFVETCWAMVCRSQLHVASEHFTYKGRRVYSQHFDVNARIRLCDEGAFECREPMAKPEDAYVNILEHLSGAI